MINIGNGWDELFSVQSKEDYYTELRKRLADEYRRFTVYPDMHSIFAAFKLTPPERVRVVVIGQDPYHNEGQAHGLCFSVKDGRELPPSLTNIYKEIKEDLGIEIGKSGDLTPWAEQGVLLLNAVLTVRAGQAASHGKIGWERFTDGVISYINTLPQQVIYLLWGRFAKSKRPLISDRHIVLEAAHPSPLSAYNGFFGCRHFSVVNEILRKNGEKEIDWRIK